MIFYIQFLWSNYLTIWCSCRVCVLLPSQLKLAEHQTTPPGYLTESELISLMEKHAIGTVSGQDWGLSGWDWRVFIYALTCWYALG